MHVESEGEKAKEEDKVVGILCLGDHMSQEQSEEAAEKVESGIDNN